MIQTLFLIGSPRSGKSILNKILISQGNIAWISHHQLFTKMNILGFYNRIYDIPIIGKYLLMENYRILPNPIEGNTLWKINKLNVDYLNGNGNIKISDRKSPSYKETINDKEKKYIEKYIIDNCRYQMKKNLLIEYSKWPKILYFNEIFLNSKYLHIIRDGRAVAYEYMIMLRSSYNEWKEKEWWINDWPNEWKEEYYEKYQNILAFSAYQWKYYLKNIWEEKNFIQDNQYLEITYEELVENPKKIINQILFFYNLKKNNKIYWVINKSQLNNMNNKWKNTLLKKEKIMLKEIFSDKEYYKYLK